MGKEGVLTGAGTLGQLLLAIQSSGQDCRGFRSWHVVHRHFVYAVTACILPLQLCCCSMVQYALIQRSARYACEQERWMEDDAEFWKPSNALATDRAKANDADAVRGRRYLPFGDGMRSCIGQSLAKMNYTATVALLLSHFTFRLAARVSPCCASLSKSGLWQ